MPGSLTAGGREGGKSGGDRAEVEVGGGGVGDGDGAGKVCEVTGGGGEYVTHLSLALYHNAIPDLSAV